MNDRMRKGLLPPAGAAADAAADAGAGDPRLWQETLDALAAAQG